MLLLVAAGSLTAQQDAPFSKSFPDGSTVRLISSTITEFRSRPRSANPDAPEKEIYDDREWKLVTYTLLLKRPRMNAEETVWSKDLEYPVADKKMYRHIGTLAVNDVLLNGDRAYVLYMQSESAAVVNPTRNKDGEWLWSSPTDLARSTDVAPIVKLRFTSQAKPQIALDMIVADKVRTWIWNLKSERWVWVKKK